MSFLRRIAVCVPFVASLTMGQARAEPVVIDDIVAKKLVAAAEKAIEQIERELAKIPGNVAPKGLKSATGKAKASVAELVALVHRAPPVEACPTPAPTPTNTTPALEADRFAALVAAMKAQSFSADREALLRAALADRGLSVAQTVEVLGIAPFVGDRLRLLELIAPRPLDLNDTNKASILDLFRLSSDRAKAEALLAR